MPSQIFYFPLKLNYIVMENLEIKNAIIESAIIDTGDRGLLTAWLHMDYGGGGQGFGGFALYLPKDWKHFTNKGDFAGHFIFRCMEIAGVGQWDKMKGKTIRVKCTQGKIEEIGHIIKEDWFNPSKDFDKMIKI